MSITPEKELLRRKHIGDALRGRVFSKKECEAISKRQMGHSVSEECRRKMSIAMKGKKLGPRSEKVKKAISRSLKGRRPVCMRASLLATRRPFHLLIGRLLEPVGYIPEFEIGNYFVDFAHPESKTVIEVDGRIHRHTRTIIKDIARDEYLHGKGWRVIRVIEDAK